LLVAYNATNGIEIMKSSDNGTSWLRDTYSDSLRNRWRPSLFSVSSRFAYLSYDDGSRVFFDYYDRFCAGMPCSYREGWWRAVSRQPLEVVPGSILKGSGFSGSSQVFATGATTDRVGVVWAMREDAIAVTDEPAEEKMDADPQEDSPIRPGEYSICFQGKFVSSSSWESVKKFVGREYRNPTISHLTNGRLLLMWTDGQSILNSQSSDYGASWSAPARLEQGVDPQVVIGAESSSLPIPYVYRDGSGPIYQLAFPQTNPVADDPDEKTREIVVGEKESDDGSTILSNGESAAFLDIEMLPVKVKTSAGAAVTIPFAIPDDSAFTPTVENLEAYLETDSYEIPHNADSIYVRIRMNSKGVSSIAQRNKPVRVKLHCTVNGEGRRTVAQWRFRADHSLNKTFRVAARPFRQRQVRFFVSLDGVNREDSTLQVSGISVHRSRFAPRLPKDESLSQLEIPLSYKVRENYPNPFNPTTTIKFDLPEPSHVSLVIYDVLGRKVAELENGMKEAGYHSTTWNASDVASGVYFARCTATDVNGNVKLSKVSKLLLTK
jgi:hypothetical protein